MFDQSHLCPDHIVEMITELQKSEFGDSILMKYHSKTISDPLLSRVYYQLNYPQLQDIPSSNVVELLHTEYMTDFPRIDSDFESLKVSFTQTFFDNQIQFLSDPVDLALEAHKQEFIETTSLTSLWADCKTSSPTKTPCKATAPKTTVRSKNGLKILSWKVKEIVERLGSSTYQEVADSLVKETEEFEGDSKDEKNIRRRVYDALNVLIAAGVLVKNNKKVEVLKKKIDPSIEKMKKFKEITEKFFILKAIIDRNRSLKNPTHPVFLPFYLVVVDKKTDKSVQVLASLYKNQACVKVNHEFLLQHSDEIIKKLIIQVNFSYFPVENFGFDKLDQFHPKPLLEDTILI